MSSRVEKYKLMIKTVIDQIVTYIPHYSFTEQQLLQEFLEILGSYDEADYNRSRLFVLFSEYSQKIYRSEEYLQTPFLWFTESFFARAYRILNSTNFRAESFYRYLASHLRKKGKILGVFDLIRDRTPLTDLAWEKLQHSSNALLDPLTKIEILIIQTIQETLKKLGPYSLDQVHLKNFISRKIPLSKNSLKELNSFFNEIEGRWSLIFHSPAFGIEKLFFHITLSNSNSLEEFLPLASSSNTILTLSDIYRVEGTSNSFLGILYVPSPDLQSLIEYFQRAEIKQRLTINDLSPIEMIHRSISLNQYSTDRGWNKIRKNQILGLKQNIKYDKTGDSPPKNTALTITPAFNRSWNYRNHTLPAEIIRFYCRTRFNYLFSELPLRKYNDKNEGAYSLPEIGILKDLHKKQVIHINFVPWQIVWEYSHEPYWINLQGSSTKYLTELQKLIPFGQSYITTKHSHLYTYLTPQLANWIENSLQCQIYQIRLSNFPASPHYSWYDNENKCWLTPQILK
jgi:hypothetical protein